MSVSYFSDAGNRMLFKFMLDAWNFYRFYNTGHADSCSNSVKVFNANS